MVARHSINAVIHLDSVDLVGRGVLECSLYEAHSLATAGSQDVVQYENLCYKRVGHRFQPTPEELVGHFLKQRQLHDHFTDPDITEANIYKYHPSELSGLSSTGYKYRLWYFFCILDLKYPRSDRVNRTAKGGSWKITGVDRDVKAEDSNETIGIKKTLVFYSGCNTRKENRTNWVMHEYHACHRNEDPLLKSKVVVCRIEEKPNKKRPSSALDEGQTSDSLAYDSGYNVAEDIVPEVQSQHKHLRSSSNSHVTNNNHLEVESQPNNHMSPVARNDFPELESQLPPKQHIYSNEEDFVAKGTSSENESQLPPKQHISSNGEDFVAKSTSSENESQLPPNQQLSSNSEDHVGEDLFSGLELLVPANLLDADIGCNGWKWSSDIVQDDFWDEMFAFCNQPLPSPGFNSSKPVTGA